MDHTATPRIYKPDSPHNASDQSTTGFSAVSETLIKNNSTSADNKNPSSQHVTECLIHGPDDGIETSVSEEPHGHKTCREQLFSYSVLTFTIATAVCMFAQLSLSVFTVTQVTSLEREYGFTTWQSGQLLSAAEIGFIRTRPHGNKFAEQLVTRPYGNKCAAEQLASRPYGNKCAAEQLATRPYGNKCAAEQMATRPYGNKCAAEQLATRPYGNKCAAEQLASRPYGNKIAEQLASRPYGNKIAEQLASRPYGNKIAEQLASRPYGNKIAEQLAMNIPPAFCVTGNTTPDTDRCPLDSEHSLKPPEDLVYNTQSYSVFIYIMMFQAGAMDPEQGWVGSVGGCGRVEGALRGDMEMVVVVVATDLNPDHPDWVGAWWPGFRYNNTTSICPCVLATDLNPDHPDWVATDLNSDHPDWVGAWWPGFRYNNTTSICPCVLATDLNPDHPDWVGAWWLGFLVFGALAAFTPIAVVTFPRLLPNASPRKVTWNRRPAKGKGIWRDALTEAKCGAEFLVGTTGFFLGGWLTRRLKLTLQSLFKLVIALLTLAVLLMVVLMMIGCPQPQLVGTPGLNTSGDMAFSHCLSACACPDEVHPVCVDGVTYFSPCHAGCLAEIDGVYVNCSCTMSGRATAGLCDTDCVSVYPFTVIFYLLLFLLSVTGAPMYLLLVRSVADYQTGLAIGINGFSSSIV
ncbi:hypothetical protein BaRGS_00039810, partial [Batillaria attramentaria]